MVATLSRSRRLAWDRLAWDGCSHCDPSGREMVLAKTFDHALSRDDRSPTSWINSMHILSRRSVTRKGLDRVHSSRADCAVPCPALCGKPIEASIWMAKTAYHISILYATRAALSEQRDSIHEYQTQAARP